MTSRHQKLADQLRSWMDEDNAVRAELAALRAVAEATIAWTDWDWNSDGSEADEHEDFDSLSKAIDEKQLRLKGDVENALAKWKALKND